jgi:hypothetical protein
VSMSDGVLVTRNLKKPPTEKVWDKNHAGGYTKAEIDRRNARVYAAQPLTVGCGRCGWSFDGLTGEALERSAAHRKTCAP